MATLAVDAPMTESIGDNGIGIIANDIVFEGAMVGDNAAGYGRPLVAGDKFVGHSTKRVDNTVTGPGGVAGAAGDLNIPLKNGHYRLIVPLVGTITDVGQPVYASDDATYTFVATSNSYVGFISRYVSATKMEVEFCPGEYDEFGANEKRETKSANYTVDAQDTGKIIYVDTDAVVITLPAIATAVTVTFVNAGSFGTVGFSISPNAADKIMGPDLAGADNKDLINTKATANRGDYVTLTYGTADGWMVTVDGMRGTWAQEA
jgi:hypothetical protein